jgi:hypothetical protein
MTTIDLPAVDRIRARAADVDWPKLLLTVLLIIPFALGWTARMVVRTVGWILAFAWASVVEGYQAGAGQKPEGG